VCEFVCGEMREFGNAAVAVIVRGDGVCVCVCICVPAVGVCKLCALCIRWSTLMRFVCAASLCVCMFDCGVCVFACVESVLLSVEVAQVVSITFLW